MSRNHDDLYDIDLLNDDLDHTHRDFRKTKPSNRLNPFGDENELIETMDLESNNVQRPNPFSDENDILENEDYLDLSDEYESTNNTTTANLHQAQSKRGFLKATLSHRAMPLKCIHTPILTAWMMCISIINPMVL